MTTTTLIPNHVPQPVENMAQLVTWLVRERGLTEADLTRAVQLQRAEELRLSEALLKLGLVSAADLRAAREPRQEARPQAVGLAAADLPLVRDPFHVTAEQIRTLRTAVLQRQPDKVHNRFAIVSGNVGDGRSRLAAMLSVAFSQLGQATLLIDADLRTPTQHHLFNLPREAGLSDTLDRGVAPEIRGVQGLPLLGVLTAGKAVSNPLDLLCSKPFADLLEGFRNSWRHVILDTTAAERGSDALAVSSAASVALCATRLHHSQLEATTTLHQRLKGSGVWVLGSALLQP